MSASAAVAPLKRPLQAGDFVMLHPEAKRLSPLRAHPDAGRIGRVERFDDFTLWVCFRDHANLLSRVHCILPRAAWLPVRCDQVAALTDITGAITWSARGLVANRERVTDGR